MLRPQPGIHSIKVALLAERGVVEYDPDTWDPDKIMNVRSHLDHSELEERSELLSTGNI